MLVVGLVIMEQNLVLYVTILVIGDVLGFAVCPCLVMAVFNVRANYIQMFTDKVSPILLKEKYFYGIFSYKIDLKQLKKIFEEHPFGLEEDKSSAIWRGKIWAFKYMKELPVEVTSESLAFNEKYKAFSDGEVEGMKRLNPAVEER